MRQKWRDALKRVVIATSRIERTGWRDSALSQRHRKFGSNAPAVDLDFVLVEFDDCRPAALVEYKHECASPQYITSPQFQVLINLANAAHLPAFAVRYAADFSWWLCVPLNDEARKHLPERKRMSEKEYVSLLYRVRGREAPQSVFDGLNQDAI